VLWRAAGVAGDAAVKAVVAEDDGPPDADAGGDADRGRSQ
jgi:hypothetical protein